MKQDYIVFFEKEHKVMQFVDDKETQAYGKKTSGVLSILRCDESVEVFKASPAAEKAEKK